MNPRMTSLVGCVLLLALTGLAGAQESPPAEASVQDQLAQLNSTMQEIVNLLKQQIDGQETSLLIKRFELSDRALVAKKERLRKNRSEAASLETEEGSLASMLETMGKELTEAAENDASQLWQLDQMEQRLKSLARRRQDLARELIELENEISTEEEDMEVLEATLDARLGLR